MRKTKFGKRSEICRGSGCYGCQATGGKQSAKICVTASLERQLGEGSLPFKESDFGWWKHEYMNEQIREDSGRCVVRSLGLNRQKWRLTLQWLSDKEASVGASMYRFLSVANISITVPHMHTTQLQAKGQDFRINELSQQLLKLKGASLTMTMLKHKGGFLEQVEVFFFFTVM